MVTACLYWLPAFQDSKRSMIVNEENTLNYYHTEMQPTNWYQWLDPDQHDDDPWMMVYI